MPPFKLLSVKHINNEYLSKLPTDNQYLDENTADEFLLSFLTILKKSDPTWPL